jgi:hypothetical protein
MNRRDHMPWICSVCKGCGVVPVDGDDYENGLSCPGCIIEFGPLSYVRWDGDFPGPGDSPEL